MKWKKTAILAALATVLFNWACKKEELDLSNISKDIRLELDFAGPLVLGEFIISDFIEEDEDSILIIEGDTVKLFIREDSLFSFGIDELATIPAQVQTNYLISPSVDIDITAFPNIISLPSLELDTNYSFTTDNSMRLDSVILKSGNITLDINNSFSHNIGLIISSTSLVDASQQSFVDTVSVPMNSSVSSTIDLSLYTIVTSQNASNETSINIAYSPIIYKNAADPTLYSSDELDIVFGINDLNDFQAIYGFLGFQSYNYDTVINFDIEGLDNITGSFNVTNPKLVFDYTQSFGMNIGADFLLAAYHTSEPDVLIDPNPVIVDFSEDPASPIYNGQFVFSKSTVSNIGELISFPTPDSIRVSAALQTNFGQDSATTSNYVLDNSELNIDLEVEVPLEFSADLFYRDTLELSGLDDLKDKVSFEYANLYYWFENSFPVGFDADLVLYDSIANVKLDTIKLNENPSILFIEAAQVDGNGNVLPDGDTKSDGYVALTGAEMSNLINIATHIIVNAQIQSTSFQSVRVSSESRLWFKFGLDTKAIYEELSND